MKVYQAIKKGIIKKPRICPICKNENNKERIEAHHHNGYDEPLDVIFACKKCHLEKLHKGETYITPQNRGHRPPLSSTEETEFYGLKLPKSLKQKCLEAGPNKVREILGEQLKYVHIS